MTKTDLVRQEMMKALKERDMVRKNALSMLLSALKKKHIDKRADLTEEEENAVVYREIKETQETLESAPPARTDIIEECRQKIKVYSEFAPQRMSGDEIRATVKSVIEQLGIGSPTAKDKGKIMKVLMPLVKGKADGNLVNEIAGEFIVG